MLCKNARINRDGDGDRNLGYGDLGKRASDISKNCKISLKGVIGTRLSCAFRIGIRKRLIHDQLVMSRNKFLRVELPGLIEKHHDANILHPLA
mgnify:CR=1 FL=1